MVSQLSTTFGFQSLLTKKRLVSLKGVGVVSESASPKSAAFLN